MLRRPTLQDFIDDELLRAPLALNPVIDAVQARWRLRCPGMGREDAQADRVLQHRRDDVIARALRALRQSALADLQRIGERAGSTPLSPLPARRELSLIGEDDVAADIEVARCVEAVKQHAETELRELLTYTSALANDLNVSRDTNPFRPEIYVRALWDGITALPLSRLAQAAFLREAAQPLAQALRLTYAAATTRLEEQGVVPAVYRTIVHPSGTGWGGQLPRFQPPAQLDHLRERMPATPHSARAASALAASATATQFAWSAPAPAWVADPQLVEMLSRLFDTMENDNGLSPDVVALLLRLQPTVTRVAMHDRALMEDYDHAVWRFMDHLAYQMALCAPGERLRLLSLCRNLVDHLASTDLLDRGRFEWAIERLNAAHRQALQQAVAAAAPVVARMQHKARAGMTTLSPLPLDIGNLDTVAADVALYEEPPLFDPTPDTPGMSGDHWRVYLQGDWRWVQLLWRDDNNDVWLMREPAADRHWALRVHGIERLRQEGLAHPLRMRSLVRRAAARLQRAL
jgi:Protein of unknown function (DUF1631)